MKNLYKLKGYEIALKLSKKEICAREVTEHFIERINSKEKTFSNFITCDFENALKNAAKVDDKRMNGEKLSFLAGIPVGIKDNICTKNLRTTCASKMLEDYVPIYDAFVVEKIKNANMIILGKNNMDEFAMGSSGENTVFGIPKNPYDITRVTGGSSSGSACAVAAGEAVMTLGTDTGGSVRLPASYCGIVGLKPTYGAVSRYGLIAFASSFDVIGPMAKCVLDTALISNVIYGYDIQDASSKDIVFDDFAKISDFDVKGLRIALPSEYFQNSNISNEVIEKVKKVALMLEKNGAVVEEVSIPELEYSLPVYYLVSSAQASSNLARYDGIRYGYKAKEYSDIEDLYSKSRSEAFGKEVKRRIILGTYVLSADQYEKYYHMAVNVQNKIRNSIKNIFQIYDFIITPSTADTAFKIGEKSGQKDMYSEDLCSVFANISGIPAITLPCGFDSNNMPMGVQIASKEFSEEKLFKAAYFIEKEIGFNTNVI